MSKNVQRQYLTCPSELVENELRDVPRRIARECVPECVPTIALSRDSLVFLMLTRFRRCTSRGFFLLLLRTRSCATGAEALSHQLNEVFAFLERAMPDRAGARPYWTCGARVRPYQSATAKAGDSAYHISDRRSLSRVTGHWPGTTAAPSEP
jgi:hypothetical protein